MSIVVLLATGPLLGAPVELPCADEGLIGEADAARFVARAVRLLEACGHDPSSYRLELREDDPLAAAGSGREPEMAAVFLPVDGRRHYAVEVRPGRPCVVGWIWPPDRPTAWQREVIERAEAIARPAGPARVGGDAPDIRITETRDLVGVEVETVSGGLVTRVLLYKADLSPVDPGR